MRAGSNAENRVVDLMDALEQSVREARTERDRARGKCPLGCGVVIREHERGAFPSLRAAVMAHEALVCPKVKR